MLEIPIVYMAQCGGFYTFIAFFLKTGTMEMEW